MKQTLIACRLSGKPVKLHYAVQKETLRVLSGVSWEECPPAIGTLVSQAAARVLGVKDPYLKVKREYNLKVKKLYPRLRNMMKASADPFVTAVRFALAGNVIDFGILESFDLLGTFEQTLKIPLNEKKIERFRKRAAKAKDILFLSDNAGEIGFDRFLVEELIRLNPKAKITLAVKGAPIINDVTIEDARYFGLDKLVPVIDTGIGWIGTHPERSSKEFREAFDRADLIVSKGMGNWESMEHRKDRRIVFLMKAKCPVVAKLMKVPMNEVVVIA